MLLHSQLLDDQEHGGGCRAVRLLRGEAGFILPDAALLIHDGWTLNEAVNARYEGIADADR